MNNNDNEILTEILLELTLKIGSETTYDEIIKTTISQWLRRLNCTIGALFKSTGESIILESIIPTYLAKSNIDERITTCLLEDDIKFFTELIIDNHFVYLYKMGDDLVFMFYRNTQLTKAQCNEIFPVVQFFAKNLDNALEREHRIAIEQQLDKEKRLLDTVINNIPYSIYVKDRELKKILTNAADIEFLGLEDKDEVLGKADIDLFTPEIAEDSIQIEKHILKTGEHILDREEFLRQKGGDNLWIRTSKFPLKNAQNDIVGILGIGRNVTEEKAVQQQIKRLSLVASQSSNGVIITDVNGHIEWINDGFTRLTGYTLDEVIGKTPGSFLQGPETDQKLVRFMATRIKEQKSFEVEIVNYSKDNKPYHIKISCNPLRDEKGVVTGYMAMESDITERVKNREELIRAKRVAEKAKDAEKTFLANMSHEIRTPMNGIIGMTSLLADTTLTEEQQEYVKNLDLSATFLLSLITDVLDLAKIEAGKVELKNIDFDLWAILQNVESSFSLTANEKDVRVMLTLDPAVPQFICSDKVLLQQVLNNFMSNAEKFTEKGKIELIVNKSQDKDNEITISVIDTGVGMTQANQEDLFQKFNQFGKNENSLNKGSGLGLCITKEIIELLGGDIRVKSEIGKGTSFSFNLPYTPASSLVTKTSVLETKILREPNYQAITKLLIAEDNNLNQLYITRLLDKMGIDFDIVENGFEAVNLAKKFEYTAILMDIQMPVMNGYEAVDIIRSSEGLSKNIPIIALTASALLEDKERAFEIGVSDYLSKPFTPDQLKEKLAAL